MEVRLVVEKGMTRKRAVRLPSARTVVGRRHGCHLRIPAAEVSRQHCELTVQDGCVYVKDLDSINGTFINGQRIVGKQLVRPGDRLEIGPIQFVVEYEMTQDTLDRLGGDELDVLPLAEVAGPDGVTFAEGDAGLDVLPLADADTELADPDALDALPAPSDEAERLPIAEELEEGNPWQLPPADDLRNLLSQMDNDKPRRRPTR
jgi:pSer/pThr/pTyr-binding forkhead associated (FHA) protein